MEFSDIMDECTRATNTINNNSLINFFKITDQANDIKS